MGAVEGVDVLVRGGTLIDGSGAPARQVDLAIHEGKVLEKKVKTICITTDCKTVAEAKKKLIGVGSV